MQLYALLTLGFPSAAHLRCFTLLHTLTRRTVLQKVPHRTQGALCACKHKVSGSFHSPPGVLFTFPSQYCSTIGHQVVFRLGGWSPHLPCGFHVPTGTLDTGRCVHVSPTRLSLSLIQLSNWFGYTFAMLTPVLNPDCISTFGLACSNFARHYFRNLVWFLFLRLLRCFSSAGYLLPAYFVQLVIHTSSVWGFPHSDIHGS